MLPTTTRDRILAARFGRDGAAGAGAWDTLRRDVLLAAYLDRDAAAVPWLLWRNQVHAAASPLRVAATNLLRCLEAVALGIPETVLDTAAVEYALPTDSTPSEQEVARLRTQVQALLTRSARTVSRSGRVVLSGAELGAAWEAAQAAYTAARTAFQRAVTARPDFVIPKEAGGVLLASATATLRTAFAVTEGPAARMWALVAAMGPVEAASWWAEADRAPERPLRLDDRCAVVGHPGATATLSGASFRVERKGVVLPPALYGGQVGCRLVAGMSSAQVTAVEGNTLRLSPAPTGGVRGMSLLPPWGMDTLVLYRSYVRLQVPETPTYPHNTGSALDSAGPLFELLYALGDVPAEASRVLRAMGLSPPTPSHTLATAALAWTGAQPSAASVELWRGLVRRAERAGLLPAAASLRRGKHADIFRMTQEEASGARTELLLGNARDLQRGAT